MQAPMKRNTYRSRREQETPGKVHWWLRMTSAGWDQPQTTFEQRDKTRRSALLAWILLGVFVALFIFVPTGFTYTPAMISIIAFAGALIVMAVLNRLGLVTAAGIVLVISACVSTFGVVLASPDGVIHVYYLPAYDFLAVPVILGASILPPISAFIIAGVNIIALYLDLLIQPKGADLLAAINTYSLPAVTARPVALLVVTAVISYLWVRSMIQSMQRADRAEELRALEQYLNEVEIEHAARVKEFVEEIINAIGALANGQEGLLLLPPSHPWQQQATFINTQLRQFHRLKQASRGNNNQLAYGINRLLLLLQRINSGQSPISALDPRQFRTEVPATDEIVRQIYLLLQTRPALEQKLNYPFRRYPGQNF